LNRVVVDYFSNDILSPLPPNEKEKRNNSKPDPDMVQQFPYVLLYYYSNQSSFFLPS
jgi:hypothetical protein